jgi:transposase
MVLIAVDPHKSSHTALAVDPEGRELGQLRVDARERRRLLCWARQWPERRWAVEGARGLGHGLSQWLVAEGESVVDVPARLVARVRLLSGGGKSDRADARAIALAAQRVTALHAVRAEDETAVLRLLSDRRDELTQERTRVVNRLHRLLRELRPGGAPPRLSADRAQTLLRRLRPAGAADRERLRMARELAREVRALDRKLDENRRRLETALRAHGSGLTRIPGVGAILAAKILGRSGAMGRFASRAHYASYTGTAPLEVSSGEVQRHRLSRRGDRQLNRALHIAALTQARMPGDPARRARHLTSPMAA